MNEQDLINKWIKDIRKMENEVETLSLKSPHNGGSYNQFISFQIGYLKSQIHIIKLKRKKLIETFYNNYNKTF